MLRKCEMSACADVGKFHFTSSKARYFTMCGSILFHVLRKQNISLYAFVSSNAVLVKKKGRGIFAILRPFPVGRYFDFYTALSQIPLTEGAFGTFPCTKHISIAEGEYRRVASLRHNAKTPAVQEAYRQRFPLIWKGASSFSKDGQRLQRR